MLDKNSIEDKKVIRRGSVFHVEVSRVAWYSKRDKK